MVDIYSLGNIYYCLLTRLWPFHKLHTRDAIRKVKAGQRPPLTKEVEFSIDPATVALRDAMRMAQTQLPGDRPSANELVITLSKSLDDIKLQKNFDGSSNKPSDY